MVLLEYIIKILVHNSETLFIGLLVILVGYYGRLLWHIVNSLKEYSREMEKIINKIGDISEVMAHLDKALYKDITERLNSCLNQLNNIQNDFEDLDSELNDHDHDVRRRINEKTEDIKETMKILLTCYRRIDNPQDLETVDAVLEEFPDIDFEQLKKFLASKKEQE